MNALLYLLPLVVALFLFLFFRRKVVWWEYLVLIIPSMLLSSALYFGIISNVSTDTEYFGHYVTRVTYFEDWNEYIHQICTRTYTDANGNSHTETYDCSYVDYHPEHWVQHTNTSEDIEITEEEYNRLVRLWGGNPTFVDMKRDYHTNDGDAYIKNFDYEITHSKTVTTEHRYKNKVQASKSTFNFTNISEKEAEELGLYNYPELTVQSKREDTDQNPIIGYSVDDKTLKTWKYINGYYGKNNEFRTYVLVFKEKPLSIVQDQRSYWVGGNKNELITCIGLDKSDSIMWVDAFSWSDKPTYEVNVRQHFLGKKKLDLYEYAVWTQEAIPQFWTRKEFVDFDYIKVGLTTKQLSIIMMVILFFNIGMGIYIVRNDVEYYG